ncbi:MAG: helix-hairpin-helix domain-containing protein [Eubacterium sp.]
MLRVQKIKYIIASITGILMSLFVCTACEHNSESIVLQSSNCEGDSETECGQTEESLMTDEQFSTDTASTQMVFVYVCGEVINPDVYRLEHDARICDAIEAAGGFTKEAARESVNLAEKVTDGQQINILSNQEYESAQNTSIAADSAVGSNTDEKTVLININTASAEELMTLPGIGKVKAEAIISYRETNGNFTSVKDIMNVTGIKEGAYNKIADMITI